MWINGFTFGLCVCAEFPPSCEGNLCVVYEDGLSSGETGSQPASVSQQLLPLCTLQH